MAMAISAPPLPALRVPGMASRHPVVFRRLPPRTLVVAAPAPAPAPRRLAPSRPPRAGDMKETSQDELLARILHLPARVLSSASSASENYSRPFHLICVVTLAAIKSPKFPGAVASVAKKLKLSDDVVRQVVFIATCVKFLYDLCKSGKAVDRLVSYFLKSPKKIPPPPSPSPSDD